MNRARPHAARVVVAVATAIAAVSAAAVLIRLAHAPALAIALHRNLLAALVLLPWAVARRERFPTGRALFYAVAAGAALALHFGLWISSLEHTSVAASVVLVCTQPIFVVLFARVLFGERTSLPALGGIAVAFTGTVVIAGGAAFGGSGVLGNALALAGAVAITAYVLLGRALRRSGTSLLPYAGVAYGTAALCLWLACVALDVPMGGYEKSTWMWIGAIALGPQVVGHTLFNWALKHVPAPLLSGTILAEPVISTALAWSVLGEAPGTTTLAGGATVLVGLAILLGAGAAGPPRAG